MKPLSGWCSTGHHYPGCPRVFEPRAWPDPAKRGTVYTTQRMECECSCHTRELLP